MERLPSDMCLKILGLLDHRNLAAAQKVCRELKVLGSEDSLWRNLFKQRWGEMKPYFAPSDSILSWKYSYRMQHLFEKKGTPYIKSFGNELKTYNYDAYNAHLERLEEVNEP